MCFYTLIIEVAVLRARDGTVSLSNLQQVSLVLPIAAFLGVILVMVFWHLTIYELFILHVKDYITCKLKIDNYRHWMSQLAKNKGIEQFNAEEFYGYLKWECEGFRYPHGLANIFTPALHTLYLIPLAWLVTLIWSPQCDWVIITALIMIPGSFSTDIGWERMETQVFKGQKHFIVTELTNRYKDM
jgi:hypothetical protein